VRLVLPLAAWMHFVRQRIAGQEPLVDPLAESLSDIANRCTGNAEEDVALFLAVKGMFPQTLLENAEFRAAIVAAYAELA